MVFRHQLDQTHVLDASAHVAWLIASDKPQWGMNLRRRCIGCRSRRASSSGFLRRPVASNSFGRNFLLFHIEIDKRLHRLHFLVGHQLVVFGNGDEVHETHVQHFVAVDMPERIKPVSMVQVSVATEHLLHNPLTILVEGRRKPAGFANPILTSKGSQGCIQVGGTCRDRCSCRGG